MAKHNDHQKQWAKIAAKAWADEDYKQRLLDDPAGVMKDEGVNLPDGVEIKCVEATDKQAWLVLPPTPAENEIADQEERIAAFLVF